jgi:hypothetical protein
MSISSHVNTNALTFEEVVNKWIPYRLQAIESLQFAWDWINEPDSQRQVQVLVNGSIKIQGNVAGIANPMIEVGLIHARALLEFLGLCASNGSLKQIQKRRPDDIGVEHFSTREYPLSMVSPVKALSAYPGQKSEAERALVAIFEWTNKGLAHLTTGMSDKYTDQHLDIACRGIPVLLHNHLYAKIGREIPKTRKLA